MLVVVSVVLFFAAALLFLRDAAELIRVRDFGEAANGDLSLLVLPVSSALPESYLGVVSQ